MKFEPICLSEKDKQYLDNFVFDRDKIMDLLSIQLMLPKKYLMTYTIKISQTGEPMLQDEYGKEFEFKNVRAVIELLTGFHDDGRIDSWAQDKIGQSFRIPNGYGVKFEKNELARNFNSELRKNMDRDTFIPCGLMREDFAILYTI